MQSFHSDTPKKNSSSSSSGASLYSAETNHSQTSSEKNINDPAIYRPAVKGIPIKLIFQQATCRGWLIKHQAPTFSFMKSEKKKRYVVLVDRLLYTFKSETTPDSYREFLEINKNTHAFATDQFSGTLYCIEIKKVSPSETVSWYLQAEDAETMKLWLSRIKSTIAWLSSDEQGIAYTKETMGRKKSTTNTLTLADTTAILNKSDLHHSGNNYQNRPYRVPSVLPPQLPPPKSLPPPIPSENYL